MLERIQEKKKALTKKAGAEVEVGDKHETRDEESDGKFVLVSQYYYQLT